MVSVVWVGPIQKERYITQFIIRLPLILVNYLFMTVLEKANKYLELFLSNLKLIIKIMKVWLPQEIQYFKINSQKD